MPGETGKIHRQIALYYFIIPVVYFLDQLSKYYAEKLVSCGSSVPVIKNTFHITLVHNTGAAFGMFTRHPHLFIFISFLALISIGYFLTRKARILNTAEKTALCFILGGVLGNLTDRLRFGYVIDFIDLRVWPVFNIADSFITIGAVILGWAIISGIRKQRKTIDNRQ